MQQPVSSQEYRAQCEIAANESRLAPDQLDTGEKLLLDGRISEKQIRQYLFVRNGILRLWSRNPLVCVTAQEVIESCVAKKSQLGLALVAYEWLVRQGFINFGCLDLSSTGSTLVTQRPKRVVVVGAGIAGLACARQLEGLCKQFASKVNVPEIIVLEGRERIGGRVYSYPLLTQHSGGLPHNLATTAEAGAQIILGFDGNPLNHIIRGQLALEYHSLESDDTSSFRLFDADGSLIKDRSRAADMVKLYNSILDTTSQYSWETSMKSTTNGFHKVKLGPHKPYSDPKYSNKPNGTNGHMKRSAGLGTVLDDLVNASREQLSLTSLDLRLINWELANFEYANGACVNQISLGGWAQAEGYVFDGKHSLIIGGYSQLPRALWKNPYPLDVRLGKGVSRISYNIWTRAQPTSKAVVECEDGQAFEADYVVSAVPLGVLKENKPHFEPPLPTWKRGAIQRMGFGLLNKVILVFERIFWDQNVDYFGMLNHGQPADSLDQKDYTSTRGKYFFIINCAKTSGRPALVALIAGEAAYFTEKASDQMVVDEVVSRLKKIFKAEPMPRLEEVIITRWKRDRFACGSYSYLGPEALPGDYDDMAKSVSNLYFAGEATCKNYPATVHGAYLSGLRAASEVFTAMAGPIPVSQLLQ